MVQGPVQLTTPSALLSAPPPGQLPPLQLSPPPELLTGFRLTVHGSNMEPIAAPHYPTPSVAGNVVPVAHVTNEGAYERSTARNTTQTVWPAIPISVQAAVPIHEAREPPLCREVMTNNPTENIAGEIALAQLVEEATAHAQLALSMRSGMVGRHALWNSRTRRAASSTGNITGTSGMVRRPGVGNSRARHAAWNTRGLSDIGELPLDTDVSMETLPGHGRGCTLPTRPRGRGSGRCRTIRGRSHTVQMYREVVADW